MSESQRTTDQRVRDCEQCGEPENCCVCFSGEDYDDEPDEFDEALDNCHGHFDEPGPGGIFQCGAVGSEDCDECPMHAWLGLTNRQIDRLEEIE